MSRPSRMLALRSPYQSASAIPAPETERLPTDEEIEWMVSGVQPECISRDAREAMTEGIKEPLRIGLRNRKMTSGDMEQVKYGIDKHFNESKVIPGEAVGVLAGLSTGEPSTQMALSSHRHAGISSKTTNEGIPRLQELVRLSQKQRAISMTIHFNEPKSLLQLRELIPLFVLRSLGDFIDSVDIDSKENMPETQWHANFRAVFNLNIPQPDYVLRLYLNVQELQRLRLSLEDVVAELRSSGEGRTYLFSSNDLGIIDVYDQNPVYNNEASGYITDQNSLLYYLRDVLLPKLKKHRITGVEGITDAFPRQLEVSTFIDSWIGNRVAYSVKRGTQNGLPITEMIELLRLAGYQPRSEVQGNVIIVDVPGGDISKLTQKIGENPDLKAFNTRWYVETNGSNLAKVLAMDMVNSEVSYTSDVTEIGKVFGIQAARDFLLDEYIGILSADAYMNPRHLIVLADVMTNLGALAPATSTGVSRQKIGPLTRSGFEKPVDHFLRAAAFGEGEKIKGVSASIFVGKPATIGENAFLPMVAEAIEYDEDEEERKGGDVLLPPPSELLIEEVEEFVPSVPLMKFVQKPSMGGSSARLRASVSASASAIPARPSVSASAIPARPSVSASASASAIPARPSVSASAIPARPSVSASAIPARPSVSASAIPPTTTTTTVPPILSPPPTTLDLTEVDVDNIVLPTRPSASRLPPRR